MCVLIWFVFLAVKCVFEDVSDCDVVHGALYRCLRAIFGLSVVGVLVCICSAMLAYQLLRLLHHYNAQLYVYFIYELAYDLIILQSWEEKDVLGTVGATMPLFIQTKQ